MVSYPVSVWSVLLTFLIFFVVLVLHTLLLYCPIHVYVVIHWHYSCAVLINDNRDMHSTKEGSMNDNINMDNTIAGGITYKINMESTKTGLIVWQHQYRQHKSNVNEWQHIHGLDSTITEYAKPTQQRILKRWAKRTTLKPGMIPNKSVLHYFIIKRCTVKIHNKSPCFGNILYFCLISVSRWYQSKSRW
jgi:hypothetical protein